MVCCSTSYKDVNIDAQFQPIQLTINGRNFAILDSFGKYIQEQQDQHKDYIRKKAEDQKKVNQETFIHPKVKEAEQDLQKRKMYLKQLDSDLERSKQEFEVLQDLLASYNLDLLRLEGQIKQITKLDQTLRKNQNESNDGKNRSVLSEIKQ
eukprot:403331959